MTVTLADLVALGSKRTSGQFPYALRYEAVVNYVSGAVWATRDRSPGEERDGLLYGFREHLVVTLGKETPMAWYAVLLQIEGFETGNRVILGPEQGDHDRAITALFRELAAFKQVIDRDRLDDVFRLYDAISTFKRR
jgi:hypothetical protein